jgi:hypothetical protein
MIGAHGPTWSYQQTPQLMGIATARCSCRLSASSSELSSSSGAGFSASGYESETDSDEDYSSDLHLDRLAASAVAASAHT